MARPEKRGLSSFTFDVDFFNDEKIEAISGEFGIKGEIVAIKLLCAIYRNGYFIEWNDTYRAKLHKNLTGISSGLLETIVQRLVKWGFFDKNLFDSTNVLTSRGIQRRYFIETRRRRQTISLPYLLIADELQRENGIVENESRIKDAPDYTAVADNDFADNKSFSPPLPFPPIPSDTIPPDVLVSNDIQQPTVLRENLCMRFNLSAEDLIHRFNDFQLDCKCREVHHTNRQDVINHFFSWLNKAATYNHNQSINNGTTNKRKGIASVPGSTEDYDLPF